MMSKEQPAQENHQHLHQALDAALARAESRELNLSSDRYIVFSDQHRGARNGADNFAESEEVYNAALGWYFENGFALIVLGDVEELWQERPASVLDAYAHSLSLEAKFHRDGRYVRLWGNHDDEWQYQDSVKRYLQPLYGGPPLRVAEALRFAVKEGDEALGALFLIHGHQGTAKSDRWSRVSRLAVRYLYRPFQRLTGMSLDTPSKDWRLREGHDRAMHSWAAEREGLVLISGHTHRPVFESRSSAAQLQEGLKAAQAKLAERPDDKRLREKAADFAEEVERAGEDHDAEEKRRKVKPCYFNTGCCCFPGGDITGIEIDRGEIRLVHWPDERGRPRPQVLERDSLKRVFEKC